MPKVENSITIQAPIERVFDYLADYANNTKWQTGVVASAYTSPEPLQAGSTFKYDAEFMGRKIITTGEVTTYDPPYKYAWKTTSGPFPVSGTATFESTESGTVVKDIIEIEPGGFFKLAERFLIKQFRDQSARDYQKLKALLEQ